MGNPKQKYLKETHDFNGGIQKVYQFPNGQGASVVRHKGSYGSDRGLWELAVLDSDGGLCYTTEITHDVIGYLNDPEVDRLLRRIEQL